MVVEVWGLGPAQNRSGHVYAGGGTDRQLTSSRRTTERENKLSLTTVIPADGEGLCAADQHQLMLNGCPHPPTPHTNDVTFFSCSFTACKFIPGVLSGSWAIFSHSTIAKIIQLPARHQPVTPSPLYHYADHHTIALSFCLTLFIYFVFIHSFIHSVSFLMFPSHYITCSFPSSCLHFPKTLH